MTSFSPTRSAEYARKKAAVLDEAVDNWLRDYREAQDCLNLEDLIGDVLAHRRELIQLDERIQARYRAGEPFSEDVEALLRDTFKNCLGLFVRAERLVVRFEDRGFAVAGGDQLRADLRELEGMFTPTPPVYPTPDPAEVWQADQEFERTGGQGVPLREAIARAKLARPA